jgi:hypothetical protein
VLERVVGSDRRAGRVREVRSLRYASDDVDEGSEPDKDRRSASVTGPVSVLVVSAMLQQQSVHKVILNILSFVRLTGTWSSAIGRVRRKRYMSGITVL